MRDREIVNKIRANTAPKGATVGGKIMIAGKIVLFSAYLAYSPNWWKRQVHIWKSKRSSQPSKNHHTFPLSSIHVSSSLRLSLKKTKGKKHSALSLNKRNTPQKLPFIPVASMLSIPISVHQWNIFHNLPCFHETKETPACRAAYSTDISQAAMWGGVSKAIYATWGITAGGYYNCFVDLNLSQVCGLPMTPTYCLHLSSPHFFPSTLITTPILPRPFVRPFSYQIIATMTCPTHGSEALLLGVGLTA